MSLVSIPSILEMYLENKKILDILLFLATCLVLINMLAFVGSFLSEKIFKRFEKRSLEKYNLYEWLGNPQAPIELYDKLSNKKDFNPKNFKANCDWLKKEIKNQTKDLHGLNHYKTYLELRNSSPRLHTFMNSFQTIIVAVVTSSLITLLNFSKMKTTTLVITYFLFFISLIILMMAIDFMSKVIDRDKFLLVLVNECIIEEERIQNPQVIPEIGELLDVLPNDN